MILIHIFLVYTGVKGGFFDVRAPTHPCARLSTSSSLLLLLLSTFPAQKRCGTLRLLFNRFAHSAKLITKIINKLINLVYFSRISIHDSPCGFLVPPRPP